jgi:hypothetical protein
MRYYGMKKHFIQVFFALNRLPCGKSLKSLSLRGMNKIFSKRERLSVLSLFFLFLATITLGELGIFEIFPYFDIPAHFLGGFFVALFLIDYLHAALTAERRLTADLLIIAGVSLLIGAGWEIFEYTFAFFGLGFKMDSLGNTIKDLIIDTLGAMTMFFLVRFRHRRSVMFK